MAMNHNPKCDTSSKTSLIYTLTVCYRQYDDISSVLEPLFGRNYDLQCVTDDKVVFLMNMLRNQYPISSDFKSIKHVYFLGSSSVGPTEDKSLQKPNAWMP